MSRRTRTRTRTRAAGAMLLGALVAALVAGPLPIATARANGPLAEVVYHGPRTARVVALTFDDGAEPTTALRIARTLLANGVPATFFPNTRWVREAPAVWRWIAGRGFQIGNHTNDHPPLTTVGNRRRPLEITTATRLIEAVTGRPVLRVLRPPFGAVDDRVREAAWQAGYPRILLWDASGVDTSGATTSRDVTRNALRGGRGSVVLLHVLDKTAAALPGIIAGYRARGFRFVTIGELLGLGPTGRLSTPPDPALGWAQGPLTGTALPGAQLSVSCAQRATLDCAWDTGRGLVHAWWDGVAWHGEAIAPDTPSGFAMHPSLALGPDGRPLVTYLWVTPAAAHIRLAARGSTGWATSGDLPVEGHLLQPALAVGADGTLFIAFRSSVERYGIFVASALPGRLWRVGRITALYSDRDPSIVIDPTGEPRVFFHHYGALYPSGTYEALRSTDGGWTVRPFIAARRDIVAPCVDAAGRLHAVLQESSGERLTYVDGTGVGGRLVTDYGDGAGLVACGAGPLVVYWRYDPVADETRAYLARHPSSDAR